MISKPLYLDKDEISDLRYELGYEYGFEGKPLHQEASDYFKMGWEDGTGDAQRGLSDGRRKKVL